MKNLSNEGQVHGGLFYSLFEKNSSELNSIVGSGVARVDGHWAFNSLVFNTKNDGYHDNNKGMNTIEIELLK